VARTARGKHRRLSKFIFSSVLLYGLAQSPVYGLAQSPSAESDPNFNWQIGEVWLACLNLLAFKEAAAALRCERSHLAERDRLLFSRRPAVKLRPISGHTSNDIWYG
jgi:hypothetical protein